MVYLFQEVVSTGLAINVESIRASDHKVLLVPEQESVLHQVQDNDVADDGGNAQQCHASTQGDEERDETKLASPALDVNDKEDAVGLEQGPLVIGKVVRMAKVPAWSNLGIRSVQSSEPETTETRRWMTSMNKQTDAE